MHGNQILFDEPSEKWQVPQKLLVELLMVDCYVLMFCEYSSSLHPLATPSGMADHALRLGPYMRRSCK